MKLSWTDTWNWMSRMLRTRGSLLFAIAGVFFFLPGALIAWLVPPPEEAATFGAMMEQVMLYMEENWHWALLSNLLALVGTIAIYLVLFGGGERTVGGALGEAVFVLPFYFLLALLTGIIVGIGFLFLILPGIYLFGRLAAAGPSMVAEGRRNPLAAIRRAWELSRGNGWRTAGFLLLLVIVGSIVVLAIEAVLGSILLLALGNEGVGALLAALLGAALEAAFSVVLIVATAGIYRELREGTAPTSGS